MPEAQTTAHRVHGPSRCLLLVLFQEEEQPRPLLCRRFPARAIRVGRAMSLCETFAAGILGMAAPMLGACLVTAFGGINITEDEKMIPCEILASLPPIWPVR